MSMFFHAQCANTILHKKERKNNWVSNKKNILKEIYLTLTFQEIQIMKVQSYNKIIKSKIQSSAFQYLKGKF